MKMIVATSLVLRYCLFVGIALVALGLILSDYDQGNEIMWAGLLVLIASPLAGVLTTYSSLIAGKDWKWVKVATVLTIIIVIVLILSLFGLS